MTHLTKENFEHVLKESTLPVIIDVFAPWCAPCKQLSPVFKKFAEENRDRYVCADINADESRELTGTLGVKGLPTLLVYLNNELRGFSVGAKNEHELKKFIEDSIHQRSAKEKLTTQLQLALQAGSLDDVKKALAAGANPNEYFNDGFHPLIFAIVSLANNENALPIIEHLLQNGASIEKNVSFKGQDAGVTPAQFITFSLQQCARACEYYSKVLLLVITKLETSSKSICEIK